MHSGPHRVVLGERGDGGLREAATNTGRLIWSLSPPGGRGSRTSFLSLSSWCCLPQRGLGLQRNSSSGVGRGGRLGGVFVHALVNEFGNFPFEHVELGGGYVAVLAEVDVDDGLDVSGDAV